MVRQFQIKNDFPLLPLSEDVSSIILTSRAGSVLFSVRQSRRRTHTEREREMLTREQEETRDDYHPTEKSHHLPLCFSLSSHVNDWSAWSPHIKALFFHRYTWRSWLPSLLLYWTDGESSHSVALSLFSLRNKNEKADQLRNEIRNVNYPPHL